MSVGDLHEAVKYLYRIAVLCGVVPLAIGVSIYVLWLVTEWDMLMVAGIFTIWGGLACATVGFICSGIYAFKLRATGEYWRVVVERVAKPVGLILVNLPVCLILFSLAWSALTRYDVTLANESDTVISRFTMTAPGVQESFGRIEPGEVRSVGVHFSGDGVFEYVAEVEGAMSDGMIEGYVTHNLGGEMHITYDGSEFHFERTWE